MGAKGRQHWRLTGSVVLPRQVLREGDFEKRHVEEGCPTFGASPVLCLDLSVLVVLTPSVCVALCNAVQYVGRLLDGSIFDTSCVAGCYNTAVMAALGCG